MDVKTESLSKILSVAQGAALEAGQMLLSHLRTDFRVSKKGRIDLVTEMDLKAEKIIVDRIRLDFPDHEILAERAADRPGVSPAGGSSIRWMGPRITPMVTGFSAFPSPWSGKDSCL